jgi:hypothetical protein
MFAGFCTLVAASSFFDARTLHLGWADAARRSLDPNSALGRLPTVWWSAPLDDTFIHFDFARSFAKLRPFEWTLGGGYSSGATSWLYPPVLALGILLGAEGQALGQYTDVVACVTVFAFLWAGRSLFQPLPRYASYLFPPAILTSGVLGWTLWSGMETGLFLALWATCGIYFCGLRDAETRDAFYRARRGLAWFGMLLVLTRPEALYCVGVFALIGVATRRYRDTHQLVYEILIILAPALGVTFLRALINLVLTGSFADAGALVKLETLNPFHESREIALRWLSHVGFQLSRITVYHTSDDAYWGFQIWLLAALGLVSKRTRVVSAMLWLTALGWILIVAQNEYVRYQNDRYTMPVVAWLLTSAALGVAGVLELSLPTKRTERNVPMAAAVVVLTASFVVHQLPRIEQQKWLFGRACRNIAEQQIRVGQLIGNGHFGNVHRVLVGDAGAIPYFSGIPALDAIGLGGTHRLPFARAVRLGVGATVELIEHLEPSDRPDLLAIYPSWWELLPVWFGHTEEEIRIRGNVICGAPNKVVYRADWHGLDDSGRPIINDPTRRLVDELDFADVLSETAHNYELSEKHAGYVVMKILPNPEKPHRDLFDAGRLVFWNTLTRFQLHGFTPKQPVELTFRVAPAERTRFRIQIDGRDLGHIEIPGGRDWQEPRFQIPARYVRNTMRIEIRPEGTENILYHLWATTPR